MKDVSVYFDESGTHRNSKLLTVAGYWFEKLQADRFSREWGKSLDRLGLSYAHMTDCALGYGQYKKLSLAQRILSEKLLIEAIKRRSRFGFAVTIDPHLYDIVMTGVEGAPSAYTLCLMTLVNHIGRIALEQRFDGIINYVFEDGHSSQKEANRYLNAIPANGSGWMQQIRYGGHAFCDKRNVLPLQAANMLAWQTGHYFIRMQEGHSKPRKDFVALIRKTDHYTEYNDQAFYALRDAFVELAPLVFSGNQAASLSKATEIYRKHNLTWKPAPKLKL